MCPPDVKRPNSPPEPLLGLCHEPVAEFATARDIHLHFIKAQSFFKTKHQSNCLDKCLESTHTYAVSANMLFSTKNPLILLMSAFLAKSVPLIKAIVRELC